MSIKIENTETYGWESTVRGMRNPLNSWNMSDSDFTFLSPDGVPCIGGNDLSLMKRLAKAGSDHGKFLRMIMVSFDITAPLYWWKEFDTYKVGTVANSCSTMHKIQSKEFTREDFSCEHLYNDDIDRYQDCLDKIIVWLNIARNRFNETKDKKYWWQMIQLLPSSYNQKRTVVLNYQVLKNMYYARKNHKLDEWHIFCDWIETLPYFKEIVLDN